MTTSCEKYHAAYGNETSLKIVKFRQQIDFFFFPVLLFLAFILFIEASFDKSENPGINTELKLFAFPKSDLSYIDFFSIK